MIPAPQEAQSPPPAPAVVPTPPAPSTVPGQPAATFGGVYDVLVYTGGGDVKAYTQAAGMTLGIRPSLPMTLSFVARAGAVLTMSRVEIDRHLTIGAQAWLRDSSIWMLRAGFAW